MSSGVEALQLLVMLAAVVAWIRIPRCAPTRFAQTHVRCLRRFAFRLAGVDLTPLVVLGALEVLRRTLLSWQAVA